MADYDPYDGGGDYTRPRPAPQQTYQTQQPSVPTSSTPQQGSASSTPQSPWPNQQQAGEQNWGNYSPYYQGGYQQQQQQYYQQGGAPQQPQQQYNQQGGSQLPQTFSYTGDWNPNLPNNSFAGTPYEKLGGYVNDLAGFAHDKLNNPQANTLKYAFGRVASRYPATHEGFQQMLADPDFQRLGLQSIGNGNLRGPDGRKVDVFRNYGGSGGQAWQWLDESEGGGAPAQASAMQGQGFDPWTQYAQQVQQYQQQQQMQQQAWQQQWQDYYNQIAAWQQQQQQQQQQQPQQQPAQAAQPTGYYRAPQYVQPTPTSPDYGGYGYNTGVGLQDGYAPAAGPMAWQQALPYLSQGMPSPYFYG